MPTILIVDDNADHRELLAIALQRHGHEIVAARDVPTALEYIAFGGIDAAVLDVRMPGESGIELCRRLRDSPHTEDLPVMLVSADVCDSRIVSALDAGADDYLTKPFYRAELTARLESLLARRRSGVTRAGSAAVAALLAARAAGSALAAATAEAIPIGRTA